MYLTWLDSNSWLIEMGGKRILLDPWLVGPLVFGNLPWFFQGTRGTDLPIPESIDLILLSQGLPDHAHPPTLTQLSRDIPVVGSPNAAKVVQELGFTQVTALSPGETLTVGDLTLQATPGSPIGPFLTENGYWLKELDSGHTLYYEPHGYHDPSLQKLAPVDVVITPLVSLVLPLAGPILQGAKTAIQAAEMLRPQIMLPTAAGGDVTFEGVLMALIRAEGSIDTVRAALNDRHLPTQILEPKLGDRFKVPLTVLCA